MAKDSPLPGLCAHCRKEADLTWDHVPPRGLLPGIPPSALLQVPACWECNNGASDYDEYFRLTIILRHHAYEHPVARKAADKAMRGLARPQRAGMLNELHRTIVPATLVSPAGLVLDSGHAVTVDFPKIYAVVRRITTGLFWIETGRPLNPSYVVKEVILDAMLEQDAPSVEPLLNALRPQPLRDIGEGAFAYRWFRFPDEPDKMVFWMQFFDDASFVCTTLDRAEHERRTLEAAEALGRDATGHAP